MNKQLTPVLSRLKSYTACFTALTFIFTNVVFPSALQAAPEVSSNSAMIQDISSLKIPESIATVETIFDGDEKDQRSVIVIQDAHSIPDAQRSIRKTILFLEKQYGAQLIGVEGASGDLDTRIFQSYPDQEKLQQVFKSYMDKGEMTGSVAAAIFGLKKEMSSRGVEFFGIEDWPVYEEGLALYLAAMGEEEKILDQVNGEREKVKGEKEKVYSPELLKVDQAHVAFEDNAKDLLAYLKILAEIQAPKAGSEIALLLSESEKGIGAETDIDAEVRRLAGKLKGHLGRLSPKGQKSFNENFQAFQTSQVTAPQFALFLKDLSDKEGFELPMSQAMMHQAHNQRRMRDLEGTKLFKDIEAYTKEIKESLFRNDLERQLDQRTHELILLSKWAKLELSREDWSEVKQGIGEREKEKGERKSNENIDGILLNDMSSLPVQPGVVSDQSDSLSTLTFNLLPSFKYHKAFYENAEQRDASFIKNLEKRLKPGETAIMIAGGFHAQGLAEHLSEKGITHALVMPNIAKLPEQSAYREHMKGNVDWKSYFEVKDGKINLYEAFVRYTRDRLLGKVEGGRGKAEAKEPSDPRILKNWRDQIIRNLADEGKLAKAGEYTRFIDETMQDKKKQELEARMQDVEKFIAGLKDLDAKNQFTAPNIAKLLRAGQADVQNGRVTTILQGANPGAAFAGERLLVSTVPAVAASEVRTVATQELEVQSTDIGKEIQTKIDAVKAQLVTQVPAEGLTAFVANIDTALNEIRDQIISSRDALSVSELESLQDSYSSLERALDDLVADVTSKSEVRTNVDVINQAIQELGSAQSSSQLITASNFLRSSIATGATGLDADVVQAVRDGILKSTALIAENPSSEQNWRAFNELVTLLYLRSQALSREQPSNANVILTQLFAPIQYELNQFFRSRLSQTATNVSDASAKLLLQHIEVFAGLTAANQPKASEFIGQMLPWFEQAVVFAASLNPDRGGTVNIEEFTAAQNAFFGILQMAAIRSDEQLIGEDLPIVLDVLANEEYHAYTNAVAHPVSRRVVLDGLRGYFTGLQNNPDFQTALQSQPKLRNAVARARRVIESQYLRNQAGDRGLAQKLLDAIDRAARSEVRITPEEVRKFLSEGKTRFVYRDKDGRDVTLVGKLDRATSAPFSHPDGSVPLIIDFTTEDGQLMQLSLLANIDADRVFDFKGTDGAIKSISAVVSEARDSIAQGKDWAVMLLAKIGQLELSRSEAEREAVSQEFDVSLLNTIFPSTYESAVNLAVAIETAAVSLNTSVMRLEVDPSDQAAQARRQTAIEVVRALGLIAEYLRNPSDENTEAARSSVVKVTGYASTRELLEAVTSKYLDAIPLKIDQLSEAYASSAFQSPLRLFILGDTGFDQTREVVSGFTEVPEIAALTQADLGINPNRQPEIKFENVPEAKFEWVTINNRVQQAFRSFALSQKVSFFRNPILWLLQQFVRSVERLEYHHLSALFPRFTSFFSNLADKASAFIFRTSVRGALKISEEEMRRQMELIGNANEAKQSLELVELPQFDFKSFYRGVDVSSFGKTESPSDPGLLRLVDETKTLIRSVKAFVDRLPYADQFRGEAEGLVKVNFKSLKDAFASVEILLFDSGIYESDEKKAGRFLSAVNLYLEALQDRHVTVEGIKGTVPASGLFGDERGLIESFKKQLSEKRTQLAKFTAARSEVRSGPADTAVFTVSELEAARIQNRIDELGIRLKGYVDAGDRSSFSTVRMNSIDDQITAIQTALDAANLDVAQRATLESQLDVHIETLDILAEKAQQRKDAQLAEIEERKKAAEDVVRLVFENVGDPEVLSLKIEASQDRLDQLTEAIRESALRVIFAEREASGLAGIDNAIEFNPEVAEFAVGFLGDIFSRVFADVQMPEGSLYGLAFNVPGQDGKAFAESLKNSDLTTWLTMIFVGRDVDVESFREAEVFVQSVGDVGEFRIPTSYDNRNIMPVVSNTIVRSSSRFNSTSNGSVPFETINPFQRIVDLYTRALAGVHVSTMTTDASLLQTSEQVRAKVNDKLVAVAQAIRDALPADEISEQVVQGLLQLDEKGDLVTNRDNLFKAIVAAFKARSEVRKAA